MAELDITQPVVKAWKCQHQNGPAVEIAVSFLLYNADGRVGQTWCLTLRQAEAIFGKDVVDTIPMLPDMKDAVPVELFLKVMV